VTTDQRLGTPDIFLGGFFTKIRAGASAIRNCADEVYQGLTIPDATFNDAPITRKRILFVCHSAGGIVTRQMLVFHSLDFRDKEVGLLLIASPSAGSKWATRFGALARFYDYKLARELAWNSWSLINLDDGFRNMIDQKQIPSLRGKEAYENRFIAGHKWLPNFSYVVEPESAGRYFGPAQLLPDTDHSTAVKPADFQHPAHRLLVQFYLQLQKDFQGTVPTGPAAVAVAPTAPTSPATQSSSTGQGFAAGATATPAKPQQEEDDPFHEFMESAMLSGSFFVEDPWSTGSSPTVVDFKKKLRDASEPTADLHNREEWEQLIGVWKPIASDPLFDVFHEEWEERPFFLRYLQDGKCALFMAHANLVGGEGVVDHCKEALALLRQVVRALPFDMKGPSVTRLSTEEARIANENFLVTLKYAREWLKSWGYTCNRMTEPPTDPKVAEKMKDSMQQSVQSKLAQLEWILERHPE
jgi:hypothetical protein